MRPFGTVKRSTRAVAIGAVLAVIGVTVWAAPASAIPTAHEITADWADSPAPTDAPIGATRTAEFHITTNDATDPYSNAPVSNVRATLTATNGVFVSIPTICLTKGVTPVSAISANGTQLLCNLGTITEGTASVIQAPVKANGAPGTNLSVSGTVTSDSATAPAGPAATPNLPISGTHGMDLILSAPNSNYQQVLVQSRTGGTRPAVVVDYGVSMSAGSVAGPSSYSFVVDIAPSVAGQLAGLQWEGCGAVDDTAQAAGIPYSTTARPNRTNQPTCSITGSGTHYTVTLSGLDYSLQHTPTVDSLGTAIPAGTNFIAAGKLTFSYDAPITQSTGVLFGATPSTFTFTDGVTQPETNTGNDTTGTTVVLPGAASTFWEGGPAAGRSNWDANLWVAPGTSQGLTFPIAGAGTSTNPGTYTNAQIPLAGGIDSVTWSTYTGAGGADLAGSCLLVQNPSAFVPEYVGFSGTDGAQFYNVKTGHVWYRTDAIADTKTETCGEPVNQAGSPWHLATLSGNCAAQTTFISPIYSDDPCLASLPAGVTAVKLTWDPAVDKHQHTGLTAYGYVPQTAVVGSESWIVGAFNAPYNVQTVFPGYPNLNNWVNISTAPTVYATIPGSTYGPNTNGQRDALRIQGATGAITKSTPQTTALPGVPVTYNLTAEADLAVQSPPAQTFSVTDTLPAGMTYVSGSGTPTPALSTDGSGNQVLTFTFTGVPANTPQPISYQAQTAATSTIAPGTVLTNTAVVDVPGDQRPVAARSASASVTVPNNSATTLGKSSEAAVLAFTGDSSAWDLTINSQDPSTNPYTDTIDVLPYKGDGRGTTIDGGYSIGAVTAAAGSTVYYTDAAPSLVSLDPRAATNGGTPGSIAGNTVGWSTTKPADVTAVRVIGPALAPGATQTIRIAYAIPAGADCAAPAPTDNKPGQVLVNSAISIAGHTALPMKSSATAAIGDCSAIDIQKYVLRPGGSTTNPADWLDADTAASYPQYAAGQPVPYRVVVTNKGTTDLTNVQVTDDLVAGCSFTVASLSVGGSVPQECTGTAAVGTTVNTASVTASTPSGSTVTGNDPAGIVVPSPYHITKASSATGRPVAVGDNVTYTIAVTEPLGSAAPFPGASLTDDLSGILDDADYNSDVSASAGTAAVTGSSLTWSIPVLVPGQTVLITYSVKVKAAALTTGDQKLLNTVFAPAGQSNCDVGSTDPLCSTTDLVPSYTVEKTVSAAQASAGDTLTYTITVRNTGGIAYPATGAGAASFTDSLTGVLDDGTLVGSPTASVGSVVQNGTDLLWSGPLDVAPAAGSVVTVTYQVKVTGAGDQHLRNTVVPTGHDGTCSPTAACGTNTPVRAYEVSKTSTPAVAYPGDVVSYTITVRNTGAAPYTDADPASFTDDLSKVTDDASVDPASAKASAGTAKIAGGVLTWTGPLDAAVVTVTYQAQVNDVPAGDLHLINAVSPTGPGGVCSTPAACTTDTPIREFSVVKTASQPTATPGDTITYTIVVTNTGTADYPSTAPASFTDSLSAVLDDASYNGDAAATSGTVSVTGNLLSWSGALSAPGTARITYSVTVGAPDRGDFLLHNSVVTPPGIGGDCPTGSTSADCTVDVPVRALEVTKTADQTDIAPGEVVTYTITVTNVGQVDYAAPTAFFTDDLTQVLDDAAYNGDVSATSGTASYAAPVLTWSGGLAVGATATITYSVTVDTPDTGDVHLHNTVVSPPGSGSNCEPGSTDPLCHADVPGPALHVTKAASSSITTPGAKVTYTITLQNTGKGDFTTAEPAFFTDDLGHVLDDATYNGDADHGATYSSGVLSWHGAIPSGQSVTITYSVTVKGGGDGYLDNTVVTPPGITSNCTQGSSDPDCFTRAVVRSFTVAKRSDAGAASQLGQTIGYTITVTNTGNAAYTAADPAGFADDLTDVLDDAVYNGDATNGASYAKPVLSWAGPLATGQTVTVTYSVTVNAKRTGNGHVYNAVTSTKVGGEYEANCRPGQSDPLCWTLTTLPDPPLALTGVDVVRMFAGGLIALVLGGAMLVVALFRRRGRGMA